MLIIKKYAKNGLKIGYDGDTELNFIYRNKGDYLRFLKDGIPVDLAALLNGKVLYDRGFFAGINKSEFMPTQYTAEVWMHRASCVFSMLLREYVSPSCAHCFMTGLYHSSRDFLRVLLLEKTNQILEGQEVLEEAQRHYPDRHKNYKAVLGARKNWKEFEDNYEIFVERRSIGRDEKAKLILSSEKIAREAYRSRNIELPKIRPLVSELNKRYDIDHILSINLLYKTKEYYFLLSLKNKKLKSVSYSLDEKEWC